MSEHEEKHPPSGGHGAGHPGGHGGGAHEEHEGAPEWLISFADNTALMMGFFVILLAMNMGPKGGGTPPDQSDSKAAKESGQTPEMLDWALSVRAAFNNPVQANSTDPRDRILAMRLRENTRADGEDDGVPGNQRRVQAQRDGDFHRVAATVVFYEGSSQLTEQARGIVADMADKARGVRLIVEVRGHVAAGEAATEVLRLRLGHDRAVSVAQALVEKGLDWRRIRVVSMADHDLLRRRAYTPEARESNQRAEIRLTNDLAPD
jgi:flagellar motor protein MotB